jgi:REP-associated tyrosine transposase
VHLLVNYPPKVSVSALVNSLKGVSARRLRSEYAGRVNQARMNSHFWSPSYFAASCGGAPRIRSTGAASPRCSGSTSALIYGEVRLNMGSRLRIGEQD